MWTIDEGVEFAQGLEKKLRPFGYFVALTGSVLHKGESAKDLDIVLFGLSKAHYDRDFLESFLKRRFAAKSPAESDESYDASATRLLRIAHLPNGKRVDFFLCPEW